MLEVTLSRRRLLAGASTLGGVALGGLTLAGLPLGGAARAADLEHVRYLTPFGYLIAFVETMYADTGGFFAKAGLEVEIQGGKGSAMAVQQVTAGNVLLSRTGGTDLIKAYAADPSLVAVGEIFQRDIFYVISSEAKPIAKPADLAGKTIGIVSTGGATENILDMMLAATDVPAKEVTREVVGNAPAAFEFINQGRVAAYIATADTVFQLKVDKRPVVAWSTDSVAPCPGQVYMTSKKLLAEKRETIGKFLKAVEDCLGAVLAAPDLKPIVDSMMKKYEIIEAGRPDHGLAVLQSDLDAYRKAYDDKLFSKPEGWTSAYGLMVKAGIIKPTADQNFYDDSARRAALS